MGCVSTKTVDESGEPPLEKPLTDTGGQLQSAPPTSASRPVPQIQVNNGPLPSSQPPGDPKDNPHANGVPHTPTPAPAPSQPIFPHVSPFKPQFDVHKDVTLSPRASRYVTDEGRESESQSAAGTQQDQSFHEKKPEADGHGPANQAQVSTGSSRHISGGGASSGPPPTVAPESVISTPRTPARTLDDDQGPGARGRTLGEDGKESDSSEGYGEGIIASRPAPADTPVGPEGHGDEGAVGSEEAAVADAESATGGEGEGEGSATSDSVVVAAAAPEVSEPPKDEPMAEAGDTPSKTDDKHGDRSAILAAYLDSRSGPEVAVDDAAAMIVRPSRDIPPEELVEDEPMQTQQHPDHPAPAGDSPANQSALSRMTAEDGSFVPMEPEDRRKLNDLLNEIERMAERVDEKPSKGSV